MLLVVVLAAAGFAALSHIAPFPFLLDGLSGNAVWRLESKAPKTIYLTYDDGPNPSATPALLDLLKEKRVRATFFLIDEYVTPATAPIVRRMFEEGHSVAQHSSDRWLMIRSPGELSDAVIRAADRIESLTERRPCKLFRPHAGWRSATMLRGLSRSGYKLVGWSWMSWDWVWFRKRTGARVASHLLGHAAPGKIFVIHDGHHRNPQADRQYAIHATRILIDRLREQGYSFDSLCREPHDSRITR